MVVMSGRENAFLVIRVVLTEVDLAPAVGRVEAGFVTRPTEVKGEGLPEVPYSQEHAWCCKSLRPPHQHCSALVWKEDRTSCVKPNGSLFDSGREAVERHVDLKRWSMNERLIA
jgi:hypothetical protein